MKRKKPSKLTSLEIALQAQLIAIRTATKKREDAIQAAEDAHYSAIRTAEKARHAELGKAENTYSASIAPTEKAWSKVFRRALQASFKATGKAMREDLAAIEEEALLIGALPLIKSEIPTDLPGLQELLNRRVSSARIRRKESGEKLAAAHDQSAKPERKEIAKAKKNRLAAVRLAKRQLQAAKKVVEANFRRAEKAAKEELRLAKAAAQRDFDKACEARKQAWAKFQKDSQAVEQTLLSSLQS